MDLLRGLRVLDATNVLAGPLCTYLLALAGAEIVKVEDPASGDFTRDVGPDPALNEKRMGASFLAQNGGKRSMTLDLKSAEGRGLFLALAATADVVVENFRPGVMKRLGLDHETVRGLHPGLVYCSLSGFGQSGPLAGRPAYDHVIQGFAGGMTISGDEATGPVKAGFQFSDTSTATMAAYAIAAALLRRQRTGEGAYLDVAMLDTTLFTLGWPMSHHVTLGTEPRPMGNHNFTGCPSGTFRTGEGLLNLVTNTQAQFLALCVALGRMEWARDERFRQRDQRLRHRAEMTRELEAVLGARSAAEWEAVCEEAGVPAARVHSIPEIIAHPQVVGRGFVHRFGEVPGLDGPIDVPTGGFWLDGRPLAPASPPPRLGQDTDDILQELGVADDERDWLKRNGVV
jgi:crotonobetainyl-CoA:carnitine CoA-transferase CaiB-like acyl-CoA transferase